MLEDDIKVTLWYANLEILELIQEVKNIIKSFKNVSSCYEKYQR